MDETQAKNLGDHDYFSSGNNVDISIEKMRELQTLIFDHSVSNQVVFDKTVEITKYMEKASREIRINYADISQKLTKELNEGKFQLPEVPEGYKFKGK